MKKELTVEELLKMENDYICHHRIGNSIIEKNHPRYYFYEGLFCSRHISTQNRNLSNDYKHELSKWQLTKFEMLMLLCYLDNLSEYFDKGTPKSSPYPVNEMCKAMDSVLMKTPSEIDAPVLYRQCRSDNVNGFKKGVIRIFEDYLTTSLDNWNQDNHQFVIIPNKDFTRAKALYKLRNRTGENQVTFLRNTIFEVTDTETFQREDSIYKRIYMREIGYKKY